MRQVVAFFCALIVAVACQSPDAAAADYEMAQTGSDAPLGETVVSNELINGDFAEDVSDEGLQKGPKVNGGFALNVIPTRKAGVVYKVANADCAGGHFVNGKCIHPFPRTARKATIEDNMLSPEQHTESGYEPDIHSFVRKHFGQKVMEDTQQDQHNAGLPGFEVIDTEMNKVGNEDANAVAEDMFPVGTDLMTDGNAESDVKINKVEMNVRHHVATPKYQHEVVSSSSTSSAPEANEPSSPSTSSHDSPSDSPTPSSPSSPSTPHPSTPVLSSPSSDLEGVPEVPVDESTTPSSPSPVTDSSEEYLPPSLSPQGEEVAEPASPIVEVEDEQGDVEAQIPHDEVEAEASLPPTPTPTPTPNYEELARQEEERRAHQDSINECIALLEKEDIQCSNTPAESDAMSSLVQVKAEPSDLRSKYQALLADCTAKTSQSLTGLTIDAASAPQRSAFSASLVKYASAMACVDAADFPSCVPTDVAVQLERPRGDWTCF